MYKKNQTFPQTQLQSQEQTPYPYSTPGGPPPFIMWILLGRDNARRNNEELA